MKKTPHFQRAAGVVIVLGIISCLLTAVFLGKSLAQHRSNNTVLLGILSAPAQGGVEVLQVLPDSPAARAGLVVGDKLVRIGVTDMKEPLDVDRLLGNVEPGNDMTLEFEREGKRLQEPARLIARKNYKSSTLRHRPQGQSGFEAPAWIAYAWANVADDEQPPTRENTTGKVVVIHAFQSW